LVHAIYGSAAGLSATGSQFWHQSIAGSADAAEDQDQFGSSLAAANFDGDGFDDLAVGVPGESSEGVFTVGAVHVLYGAAGGLSIARNWWFNQNTPGMLDEAEQLDSFGNPVVAGAFNRDGYADLAIGIVREGIGTVVDCGAVSVVHGSRLGLTTIGNQLWHQGSPGILGDNDSGQFFGTAIAATPPAWLFVDDFETGDLGRWSGAVP
jgi:hypothetical protein